jgi:hypothetical protein
LEDVTLLARLFDPPSRSKLCIDDHRDMSGSGYRRGRLPVGQRRARVEATDNRVILLSSQSAGLFGQAFYHYRKFFMYSKMFGGIPPSPTHSCRTSMTSQPLMMRLADYSDRRMVAIMAQSYEDEEGVLVRRDLLCLWPPPSGAMDLLAAQPQGLDVWKAKFPKFPPEKPDPFCADVVFSFQGMAFWCDLAQGVLFCRCATAMASCRTGSTPVVPFRYVELPLELQPQHEMGMMERFRFSSSRTISYVGKGIKLVVIGRWHGVEEAAEMEITLLTLDTKTMEWSPDGDALSLGNLWAMEGFQESGSPEVVPTFPVLSPQDDGEFFFCLEEHEELEGRWGRTHLCRLNMRTRHFLHCGFLSHKPSYNPPPALLACEFFSSLEDDPCLCPLAPGKCKASLHPVAAKRSRGEEEDQEEPSTSKQRIE